MKRKMKWGLALAVLLVAVVAVVWGMWPAPYDAAVPAQAKAVLRVDLSRDGGRSPLAQSVQRWLGFTPAGVDASRPAYAFITPNEYVGLVMALDDESAFLSSVKALQSHRKASLMDDADGMHWAWMNAGWLVGWDGSRLVALGPGVAQERDELRQTIVRMCGSKDRFTDTGAYSRLTSLPGGMQLYAQLDAMPAPYNVLFRLNVPADCPREAVQVFASVRSCGQNGWQADYTVESENADVRNAIDQFERSKGCIRLHPDESRTRPLLLMATRTHGRDLLDLLQSDGTLRDLLAGINSVADADRMLGTSNGLLTLKVGSIDKDWNPSFELAADNADASILNDADYWLECAAKQKGVTLLRKDAQTFVLTNEKQTVQFGTHQEAGVRRVYFASPSMVDAPASARRMAETDGGKDGLLAYFEVDMNQLRSQPCLKGDSTVGSLLQVLMPASQRLVYEARAGRKGTLKVE